MELCDAFPQGAALTRAATAEASLAHADARIIAVESARDAALLEQVLSASSRIWFSLPCAISLVEYHCFFYALCSILQANALSLATAAEAARDAALLDQVRIWSGSECIFCLSWSLQSRCGCMCHSNLRLSPPGRCHLVRVS